MEESSKSGEKNSIGGSLNVIEKSWEWAWVMRLTTLVLFVDMSLIFKLGHGVGQWDTTSEVQIQNIGFLATVAISFGLTVALALPLAGGLLQHLLNPFIWGYLHKTRPDPREHQTQSSGYVLARQMRYEALKEGSAFLLKLYEDNQRELEETRQVCFKVGNILFSILCMTAVDVWLVRSGHAKTSLVNALINVFGDGASMWAAAIWLGACVFLVHMWFPEDREKRIYYPPLAERLEAERRTKESPMLPGYRP